MGTEYTFTTETILTFAGMLVLLLASFVNYDRVKKAIGKDAAWRATVDQKLEQILKQQEADKTISDRVTRLETKMDRVERDQDSVRKLGGAVFEPLMNRRIVNDIME